MNLTLPPFNVWLITPETQALKSTRSVRVLDTFDSSGSLFHPDGLFSVETFGRQGSPERDKTISYVALNTTILHPEVFVTLKRLRALYIGIISGKRYAVWNEVDKDFDPSDSADAKTGFSFFISHFPDIVFKRNNSDVRNLRIDLVEKYQNKALLTNHLILPAGLRDAYVAPDGQVSEDEINDLYRKLISTSTTISNLEENKNSPNLDTSRWSLQLTANSIFEYIVKLQISGKRGWFQQKFGSRKTRNGSASVITAMTTAVPMLGAPSAISVTDTEIGLLQTLRNNIPEVIGLLKRNCFSRIFSEQASEAWLINPKTLQRELVNVSTYTMDLFTTNEGINKFVNRFFLRDIRNNPVLVEKHYLGLVYVDKHNFKLFYDINELPEHLNKSNVSPATLADILHLTTYQALKSACGTITRYPITGDGSIYPTFYKTRTTTLTKSLIPLGDDWQPVTEEVCYNFHDRSSNAEWIDSLTPHITRLVGLGADFDGDKNNSPSVNTKEAKAEVSNYFKKKTSFVGANGRLLVSTTIDTVELVVRNLTGDAE